MDITEQPFVIVGDCDRLGANEGEIVVGRILTVGDVVVGVTVG